MLTYLELEGVLEATGPFYAAHKIRPLCRLEEVLARRRTSKADLQLRMFHQARPARAWYSLDLEWAAEALLLPRGTIAALLADLEIDGLIELKSEGLRQGYRRLPGDHGAGRLRDVLSTRFLEHEGREVERIGRMLAFARTDDCLTRGLLAHFGEALVGDCGHCDRCLGTAPDPITPPLVRAPGRADRELVVALRAEGHAALATPRQLARFLCGLTSPATTRARLTGNRRFGALADVPFHDVLRLTEARRQRNPSPLA